MERSSRSKSRTNERDRKYDRFGEGDHYDRFEVIVEKSETRHDTKSKEKRKWRKEKKRAQKLAATKAPKVDDVEQIRKGLEALDFNKEDDDVEMGLKFESQKKTVSAFAAGVSDERFRRDWSIRQIVRGVYFDVINQDMQDDDYVINNNIVKVRTVSDKYCFFKSLLNVCKLP